MCVELEAEEDKEEVVTSDDVSVEVVASDCSDSGELVSHGDFGRLTGDISIHSSGSHNIASTCISISKNNFHEINLTTSLSSTLSPDVG